MSHLIRSSRTESRVVGISRWCAISVSMFLFVVTLGARCGASHDAEAHSGDGSAQAAPAGGASASAAGDPKAFCAALLAATQPLLKVPLTVTMASDANNDELHGGEPGYAECRFTGKQLGVTIILSDEKSFDSSTDKGFIPLSGFGDKARAHEGSIQWVDVMKGKTFCEAIVTVSPDQVTGGDWKQAGGKMCIAAYARR